MALEGGDMSLDAGRVGATKSKSFVDETPEASSNHGGREGNLSWRTVSMIQIGEIVGVGVLTMGLAFAEVGYALAIVLIGILGPINIYIGMLIHRTAVLYPNAHSYSSISDQLFKNKFYSWFVKAVTNIYMLFTVSSYFLALTQTLSIVFWGVGLCDALWGLVAFGALIVPIQVRSFTTARIVFWINFACIVVAIFMVLIYLFINMKDSTGRETTTGSPPEGMTWIDFFGALSKITFAYLGCYVYFEMIAEMGNAGDFPKSFYISAPVQIGLYLLVGIVSYTFSGENASDSILKEVDPSANGGLVSAAAVCLALHLLVSYFIIACAFHRNVHEIVSPSTVNDNGWRGRLVWFVISFITLIFSYVVSNGVYFFDSLVSLLGSLFGPILAFLAPMGFFWIAYKESNIEIALWEKIFLVILSIYSLTLLCAGTAANIISLMDNFVDSGAVPFQCLYESYQSTF